MSQLLRSSRAGVILLKAGVLIALIIVLNGVANFGSERGGGDRAPQLVRRSTELHPDDGTAGSDLCQHLAGTGGRKQRASLGRHALPGTVTVSDGVGEAIASYVNLNAMRRIHGRQ